MAIYIGNTQLRRILDFTSKHFRHTQALNLTLENNPLLEFKGLSLDGEWAKEDYYYVFEVRGQGLKSFHKSTYAGDLVLRNLPKSFDALKNCDYIHAAYVTFEGSLPFPCHINAKSDPSAYTLINVHAINGERVLDPKVFCQAQRSHKITSIVNSEVVIPERCFQRRNRPLHILQGDLWNLQEYCILEISSINLINGFDIPSIQEEKLDRAWRSRAPEDCKHFCFGADGAIKICNRNTRKETNFLCAFCLRNKFGKQGDKFMENICDYHGPMTLEDKLHAENDKNKEEIGDDVDSDNHTGDQASRPSHFTQLRFSYPKVFVALMMNTIFELST